MSDDVNPCPECRAGKCGNCNDLSWSQSLDGLVECPCFTSGHQREGK